MHIFCHIYFLKGECFNQKKAIDQAFIPGLWNCLDKLNQDWYSKFYTSAFRISAGMLNKSEIIFSVNKELYAFAQYYFPKYF